MGLFARETGIYKLCLYFILLKYATVLFVINLNNKLFIKLTREAFVYEIM